MGNGRIVESDIAVTDVDKRIDYIRNLVRAGIIPGLADWQENIILNANDFYTPPRPPWWTESFNADFVFFGQRDSTGKRHLCGSLDVGRAEFTYVRSRGNMRTRTDLTLSLGNFHLVIAPDYHTAMRQLLSDLEKSDPYAPIWETP